MPLSVLYASSVQLPSIALMEQLVWLMDQWRVLAEWRSASKEYGEDCVVNTWVVTIPEYCADSWGTMSKQVKKVILFIDVEEDW